MQIFFYLYYYLFLFISLSIIFFSFYEKSNIDVDDYRRIFNPYIIGCNRRTKNCLVFFFTVFKVELCVRPKRQLCIDYFVQIEFNRIFDVLCYHASLADVVSINRSRATTLYKQFPKFSNINQNQYFVPRSIVEFRWAFETGKPTMFDSDFRRKSLSKCEST